MEAPFIKVGADKEAVIATKEAILEILETLNDQKTIQIALSVFSEAIQTGNTAVTNCNFANNEV